MPPDYVRALVRVQDRKHKGQGCALTSVKPQEGLIQAWWTARCACSAKGFAVSQSCTAGAAGMVGAVARRALPARGVGEPPRRVGPEALVERAHLRRGQPDPGEHAAQ